MISWEKLWTRKYTLNRMEPVILCLCTDWAKKLLGKRLNNFLAVAEQSNCTAYVEKDEFQKVIANFCQSVSRDSKSFQKFEKIYLADQKRFLKIGQLVHQADFPKLNNQELAKLLERIEKPHLNNLIIAQWLVYYFAEYLPELIQAEIASITKDPKTIKEYLEIIFTPSKQSQTAKERLDLLRIAAGPKKDPDKSLEQHAKKYHWIPVLDCLDQPWDKKYFKKELSKILKKNPKKELLKLHKKFDQDKKAWEKLITMKSWNIRQKELFKSAHQIAFYKDDRDDARRYVYAELRLMFQEIAQRLSLSLEELCFLNQEEIIKGLKTGSVSKTAIKARQKFFVLLLKDNEVKIITGQKAKKLAQKLEQPNIQKTTQIPGIPSTPGKYQGKAKIVKSRLDLKKINSGDVMVAVTTHPDFVPVMCKCKAIVTDEGGFLSHAAIVSREFKIPCIVGTKIATQVLNDGDQVEIDAGKGIVKIINN